MSEFIEVLDRIKENLQNGQPMFDCIEYKSANGWQQAQNIIFSTQSYRVKPVVTGMFSAESLKDSMWQKGPRDIDWSELSDELNAFVESKLPAVREQAIREFIEYIGAKYPNWQRDWLYNELSEMKNTPYLQGSGNPSNKPEGQLVKGPERGEPKPANEQTITLKIPESAAPIMPAIPEQRITIQPGDYVPHELITSEAVFNLVVKAFSVVEFIDYEKFCRLGKKLKGIGTKDVSSNERPLTLQQLFNATNGFEWPEGTKYITDTCGNVEFSKNFNSMTPGVKVLATRVK